MGEVADLRLRHEVDEQVGHADLGDQVDEDGRDAEHQVAMPPQRMAGAFLAGGAPGRLAQRRQLEAGDDYGQHHQHRGHDQVGQLHRLRVGQAFGLAQHGVALGGAGGRAAEDQVAAEQRRQGGADRVERLHQVEPRRGGVRVTDDRDVGIGRDLQQGDAAGDHEQRAEGDAVGDQARGRDHAQRAERHDAQADHQRALVADAFDQLGRRQRGEEVGDEPHRLDQRGLGVAQLEHAAQVRQQRVVDDGDEAPHEEQRGQQRQRGAVGRRVAGERSGGGERSRRPYWSCHRAGVLCAVAGGVVAACNAASARAAAARMQGRG